MCFVGEYACVERTEEQVFCAGKRVEKMVRRCCEKGKQIIVRGRG